MNTQTFATRDVSPCTIDGESHEIPMIRMLLASDQANMHKELKRIFVRTADIEVAGEAISGKALSRT